MTNMQTLTRALNELIGYEDRPRVTATKAANIYAGTTGYALVGALNKCAGTSGLDLGRVLNTLAGTSGLPADAAASAWADAKKPTSLLTSDAVFYIDSSAADAGSQTVANRGTGGSALNAVAGSGTGVDAGDPKYLSYSGTPYVYLPAGGNRLSVDGITTGSSNLYDISARIAFDDWTPSSDQDIFSQAAGDPNRGARFYLRSTGRLEAFASKTGSSAGGTIAGTSSVAPTVSDGQALWVRVTIAGNVGGSFEIKFWTAPDSSAYPSSWTQLGTTVTGTGVTLPTVTGQWRTTDGGTLLATAKFWRGVVKDGTTTVLDIDTSVLTSGSQTSFQSIDASPKTVTVTRSATGRKTTCVVAPVWLLGTDDMFEVADNDALLDMGASDSFTVLAAGRRWDTASTRVLVAKKGSRVVGTAGWVLYGQNVTWMQISDGTTQSEDASGSVVAGAATVWTGVRNTATDRVESWQGAVSAGSAADATTGTLANALPLRVGRLSDTLTDYLDGELAAAAVWRRALSSSEIAALTTYFAGRLP